MRSLRVEDEMNLTVEEFSDSLDGILDTARKVEGQLTERDMRFLALAAAFPTADGEIFEIGSFKGKSTIILAKSAALTGCGRVVAVDPLTSPAVTDPDLKGRASALKDFYDNLKAAGVDRDVEFHQMRSQELAKQWTRKIRLLWIDGDHTYAGTKQDFDLFSPFLADGAIVAFHDVLYKFEGPPRVFLENVILSANFGAAGLCGYIGWAQYFDDPNAGSKYRDEKNLLSRKLNRLIPYVTSPGPITGWRRIEFKLLRMVVPQTPVDPSIWCRLVKGV
jgi:MMP 1-O-methyltransferase